MWLSGLLSAICFSLMSITVAHFGTGITASEFLLGRSLVGLVFLAPFVYLGRKTYSQLSPILIWRGIIGTLAIIILFIMIQNVGPATATAIHYTSPVYVFAFSLLLHAEHFSAKRFLALFLVIGGVIIPVFDQASAIDLKFLFLGSLGALLSGLSFFLLKMMTEKASEILIYLMFCMVQLVTQTTLHFTNLSQDFHLRFGLIISHAGLPCLMVGALACAAQLLMNNSFKKLSGTSASLLNLLCIPITALIEHFVFNRSYDVVQSLMMVFIFLGILLLRGSQKVDLAAPRTV